MARHSDLGSFGLAMHQKASRVDKAVGDILKETVLTVVGSVAEDTPILSGQAQSNWLTSVSNPKRFWIANAWQNAGWYESLAMAQDATQNLRSTDVIHITNNLPYIVKLNQGYSRQAPAMYVESAILRATYRLRGIRINLG